MIRRQHESVPSLRTISQRIYSFKPYKPGNKKPALRRVFYFVASPRGFEPRSLP
jgi:hypothetical protein